MRRSWIENDDIMNHKFILAAAAAAIAAAIAAAFLFVFVARVRWCVNVVISLQFFGCEKPLFHLVGRCSVRLCPHFMAGDCFESATKGIA